MRKQRLLLFQRLLVKSADSATFAINSCLLAILKMSSNNYFTLGKLYYSK
jgi:hypothetical protein